MLGKKEGGTEQHRRGLSPRWFGLSVRVLGAPTKCSCVR
jgi:hypothetical protein